MKIQDGYDNKPTQIKFEPNSERGIIGVWIKQEGLSGLRRDNKTGQITTHKTAEETLAYMTMDEAFELFKELRIAFQNVMSMNGREM